MKYIWLMFLGTVCVCHASELQEHPKDVTAIAEILCSLYDERNIHPRANEETEAVQFSQDATKKMLLRIGLDGQEIHLQTPEGLFALPTRRDLPTTCNLEIKLKKALKEKYTVTNAAPDEGISCCTSDCTFIYELKKKVE